MSSFLDPAILFFVFGIAAGEGTPSEAGPARRKGRALELLAAHLLRRPSGRPLLLVVEDAYWADPTTLELLDRLAREAASLPVLLVVTSRPGFTAGWGDLPHLSVLPLDRLGREDSARLAAVVAEGRVLPPSLLARVAVEAGVPMGWERYVGPFGKVVAVAGRYGASAPVKVVMEKYGFTPQHVADEAIAAKDAVAARLSAMGLGRV